MTHHRANSHELLPIVYDRLRSFAKSRFQQNHSLFGTDLVHEAFLRVNREAVWDSEAHFFGAIRNAMRNAFVDHLRKKQAIKHGGGHLQATQADVLNIEEPSELSDIIALTEALDELSLHDPRAANIVTLRFFGCMTEEEVAQELQISRKTVTRDWSYARLWLQKHMQQEN